MSTRVYCDGCGKLIDTSSGQNYWQVTLEGDVPMSSLGEFIYPTGLRKRSGKSGNELGSAIRRADICVPCIAKIQEENE